MSSHFLRSALVLLVVGMLLQSARVRAESFEVINYAPPRGWLVQNLQDGKSYERPDRKGSITLYADWFGSPEVAFAVTWRELVEPAVPGPAPTPQFRRHGDFTVASGLRQARSADKAVAVQLVTIAGRGRRVGIVGMADGEEALRELAAFFDSVVLTPDGYTPDSAAFGLVGSGGRMRGTTTTGMSSPTTVSILTRRPLKRARPGLSACREVASHSGMPRVAPRAARSVSSAWAARSASNSAVRPATGLLIGAVRFSLADG
jgi:hypothetical protein